MHQSRVLRNPAYGRLWVWLWCACAWYSSSSPKLAGASPSAHAHSDTPREGDLYTYGFPGEEVEKVETPVRWRPLAGTPVRVTDEHNLTYTLVPPERLAWLRRLLRLERVAYCAPELITVWNCGLCSDLVEGPFTRPLTSPDAKRVKGFLHVNHDLRIIALSVQGAKFRQNWMDAGIRYKLVHPNGTFPGSPEGLRIHRRLGSTG
jgi:hypothetical protein